MHRTLCRQQTTRHPKAPAACAANPRFGVIRCAAALPTAARVRGWRRLFLGVCLAFLCHPLLRAGTLIEHVDPDTGLRSWKVGDQAFSIELVQVLPDYVRAVYSARGLPREIVDEVSSYCVFGTIIRNTTSEPLSYRVADWRYITPDGTRHPLKTKSEWVEEWHNMGVAFRWSMLADEQTFAEGDWVQGFSTVKLPPGSRFDLSYSWSQHGKTITDTIEGLRCAPADLPQS
jgi:hypothetical protein